jgi:5-methylcytosine-specific restriction protein B
MACRRRTSADLRSRARDSAQTDTGLRRVWKSSILPLLEEHHYGESIDVAKRYDLARILRSIAPDEAVVVGSDKDVSSDPEQEPDEVF